MAALRPDGGGCFTFATRGGALTIQWEKGDPGAGSVRATWTARAVHGSVLLAIARQVRPLVNLYRPASHQRSPLAGLVLDGPAEKTPEASYP